MCFFLYKKKDIRVVTIVQCDDRIFSLTKWIKNKIIDSQFDKRNDK